MIRLPCKHSARVWLGSMRWYFTLSICVKARLVSDSFSTSNNPKRFSSTHWGVSVKLKLASQAALQGRGTWNNPSIQKYWNFWLPGRQTRQLKNNLHGLGALQSSAQWHWKNAHFWRKFWWSINRVFLCTLPCLGCWRLQIMRNCLLGSGHLVSRLTGGREAGSTNGIHFRVVKTAEVKFFGSIIFWPSSNVRI